MIQNVQLGASWVSKDDFVESNLSMYGVRFHPQFRSAVNPRGSVDDFKGGLGRFFRYACIRDKGTHCSNRQGSKDDSTEYTIDILKVCV